MSVIEHPAHGFWGGDTTAAAYGLEHANYTSLTVEGGGEGEATVTTYGWK